MPGLSETALVSLFVSVAIKSTAVLGLGWVVAVVLRRNSASARHLVWSAAAAAVLALPLLSALLPALRVPAGPKLLAQPAQALFHITASPPTPSDRSRPAAPRGVRPFSAAFSVQPRTWEFWLVLLWVCGAVMGFAQMLAACAAIARVHRSATPFPRREVCGALSRSLGIRRPVEVLETEIGSMPMTFGILRSAIFMPADAARWSEDQLRVVLLHELAHVRRGDVATHLLARAAVTFYWWNPLAWMAWREFLKERERAADDLVLKAGARASDYAGHLLAVARTLGRSADFGWAAVAMARRSQLEGRLAAILDSGVNRTIPGRAAALVAALTAIAVVAPLAALRAQERPAVAPQAIPADVQSAVRAAQSQKNYQILEDAAKTAERLYKYDTAQQLLQPAAEIRAEVAGPHSIEYGIGLLKLGDLESKRGLKKSAEDFYSRAAQILGDRPEASRALLYLGQASIRNGEYAQALDYLQRVQRIDFANAGAALMWMAIARDKEHNAAGAEELFKNALLVQQPGSLDAVVTMRVYAQFLRRQDRAAEADELDSRAAAGRKANPVTYSSTAYRIGPGITPPGVLRQVEPQYSEEARLAKYQGTVLISTEIGPDGLAQNIQVVRGLGLGLDEKAVQAIGQWRFRPGTKDGQPVTVIATIEVNFKLL